MVSLTKVVIMNSKAVIKYTIFNIFTVCFCYLLIVSIFMRISPGHAISCFTCSSRNLSNSDCHDPFHPANVTYTTHCKVGKTNHVGLFPANFCVKVKGRNQSTNEELVIRHCSMENMDNQCGIFKFNGEVMDGCILTCGTDGCNGASNLKISMVTLLKGLVLCLVATRF